MSNSDHTHPQHIAATLRMPASPELLGQLWQGIGPSTRPFSDDNLAWALQESTACDAAFIIDTRDPDVRCASPAEASITGEMARGFVDRSSRDAADRTIEYRGDSSDVFALEGCIHRISSALIRTIDLGEGGVRCCVLVWREPNAEEQLDGLKERLEFVVQMLGIHRRQLRDVGWRRRVSDVVRRALSALERAQSRDAVYNSVIDAVCDTFGGGAGAIYMRDPATGRFRAAAWRCPGDSVGYGPAVLAADEWPLSGMREFAGLVPPAITDQEGSGSFGACPLWVSPIRSSESMLGVILVQAIELDDVDGDIRSSLDIAGYLLGVALDRLRIHLEMRTDLAAHNRRWQEIYAIATRLTQLMGSGELLSEILSKAVELLNCDQGIVLVRDGDSETLQLRFAYSRTRNAESLIGLEVPLQSPAIGQAMEEQRAVALHGSVELQVASKSGATIMKANSLVAVPLVVEQASFGVLVFACNDKDRSLEESDIQTLALICQQASAVLEKERSQQRLARLRLTAERERMAMALHDGLSQTLAAVMIRADLCQEMGARDNPPLAQQLELISQGLQRAIGEAQAAIAALEADEK